MLLINLLKYAEPLIASAEKRTSLGKSREGCAPEITVQMR